MYYQYELVHFKGNMGRDATSDGHREMPTPTLVHRRCQMLMPAVATHHR